MTGAHWDVQVLGLDHEKRAEAVIDAVSKHLGAEVGQIERLLAHAPTTLVADLDEAAAKSLVVELRQLGLRVKPRPTAQETERSGPPVMADPAPSVVTDERATAPTLSVPTVPAARAAPDSFSSASDPVSSARSPLEHLSESALSQASGLELEDVPLPPTRPKSVPPERLSIPPRISTPPPVLADLPDETPRVFWSALPSAFLVPLRRPVLPGLVLAPLFMGVAVLFSLLGTFMAIVGVLVMTAAFLGVTLQVSNRCLWATAVGERIPASLPDGFLSEYAFPGMGIVVVQAVLGGLFGWMGAYARSHGVPLAVIELGMVFFALYGVIGFALAAANLSAVGFLDVARILRILVRAPLEVLAIAGIGALVQGGAVAVVAVQVAAAIAAGGIGMTLLALAGSTLVVSFAAAYGAALTATMMGLLFWARPEVATG